MLVLSRKEGESIQIGDNVTLKVLRVQGDRVRLGIEAPRTVSVVRSELNAESRRQLAETSQDSPAAEEFSFEVSLDERLAAALEAS